MNNKERAWRPPILGTIAITGEGIQDLVETLEEHRCFLERNPNHKRTMLKKRTEAELVEAIKEKVSKLLLEKLRNEGELENLLQKILERRVDPASAAEELVKKVLNRTKT
jgi:LAO/AO transport system kinase